MTPSPDEEGTREAQADDDQSGRDEPQDPDEPREGREARDRAGGEEERAEEETEASDSGSTHLPRLVDVKWAVTGGVFAAVIVFFVGSAVGLVGEHEARHLVEATIPTVRFLASGVLAAGATILALMLTLLSLTQASDFEFNLGHYRRIELISLMNAVAIIVSVMLLVFLSVPLEESEEKVPNLYPVVYYMIMVGASLLGGMTVSIVLMLHNAVRGLVGALGPQDASSHLIQE